MPGHELVESNGFDAKDQMNRYLRWRKEGYLSSTGRCFDIGVTVANTLQRFEQTGEPFAGSADPNKAGNGSIMRLAPVPLYFARDPTTAIARAAESSRTTHGAKTTIDAYRYLAALLVGALSGATKAELLAPAYCSCPRCVGSR